MYEKTFGKKYQESLDAAQIAKNIRTDIQYALKKGLLPKGLKTSVRLKRFSGGQSIDIIVRKCPIQFMNLARVAFEIENPWKVPPAGGIEEHRYTEEARVILARLTDILNAYNFDGSEPQADYFNVNYYGHVNFASELESAVRDRAQAILKP